MATNLDIITDALRLANIIRETETPSAAQSDQAMTTMNDMLADWNKDGIELGYYPQSSLSGTIPLEDEDLRGVKFNLADELAGRYGTALTPQNAKIAKDTKARLEKATVETFENSFDHLPGAYLNTYNINNN